MYYRLNSEEYDRIETRFLEDQTGADFHDWSCKNLGHYPAAYMLDHTIGYMEYWFFHEADLVQFKLSIQ